MTITSDSNPSELTLAGSIQPQIAVLFLQPHCNMACTFCITQDGFQVLTEAEVRRILTGLQALGVNNVIFGGGEPLSWPHDILAVARFAKDLNFTVQIGTNGIGLKSDHIGSRAIDRFILPLESLSAPIHNAMRISKGGHQDVILDRLQQLGAAGRQVTVSTVITKVNRAGLKELGEFLNEYHQRYQSVHAWHLYRMLSQGRGGSIHGTELDTGLEAYNDVCAEMKKTFPTLRIFKRPDMSHSATVGFYWMNHGKPECQSPFGPIHESFFPGK